MGLYAEVVAREKQEIWILTYRKDFLGINNGLLAGLQKAAVRHQATFFQDSIWVEKHWVYMCGRESVPPNCPLQ